MKKRYYKKSKKFSSRYKYSGASYSTEPKRNRGFNQLTRVPYSLAPVRNKEVHNHTLCTIYDYPTGTGGGGGFRIGDYDWYNLGEATSFFQIYDLCKCYFMRISYAGAMYPNELGPNTVISGSPGASDTQYNPIIIAFDPDGLASVPTIYGNLLEYNDKLVLPMREAWTVCRRTSKAEGGSTGGGLPLVIRDNGFIDCLQVSNGGVIISSFLGVINNTFISSFVGKIIVEWFVTFKSRK